MRHAKRVDRNHAEIRDALRKAGWIVTDLSHVGHGCPDLVAEKCDRCVWLEVKDGTKPPSARKLTEDEVFFHELLKRAGIVVQVIETLDEAMSL